MLANRVMMGSWKKSEDAGLPVTDGLLGWWKFDEGTGQTVIDHSGNGNHGTLYGPQWTAQGLAFGLGDYVEIPHLDFYTNGELTYVVAFKVNSTTVPYPTIIGNGDEMGLYLLIGHHESFAAFSPYLDTNISEENSLPPINTDMIFTVTYDSFEFRSYLNGVLIYTQSAEGAMGDGSGPFYLSDIDDDFAGELDFYYALVYDRSLSVQEVADAYEYVQTELAKRGVTI